MRTTAAERAGSLSNRSRQPGSPAIHGRKEKRGWAGSSSKAGPKDGRITPKRSPPIPGTPAPEGAALPHQRGPERERSRFGRTCLRAQLPRQAAPRAATGAARCRPPKPEPVSAPGSSAPARLRKRKDASRRGVWCLFVPLFGRPPAARLDRGAVWPPGLRNDPGLGTTRSGGRILPLPEPSAADPSGRENWWRCRDLNPGAPVLRAPRLPNIASV